MNPATELEQQLSVNLSHTLYGMDQVIHGICLALIAKGQILLEGVPGLGKTLLAKTLANQLQGKFKRIQCTADMMPSDMTGIHVYNNEKRSFELLPGPLFADVVLVDEINRTGPKTQSALLEAMEEGSITIDRDTYHLPEDFFVIAAQNPHEFEGTYPLPESQLDRFLLRINLDYPSADTEKEILKAYSKPGGGHFEINSDEQASVIPEGLIAAARKHIESIRVAESIYDYIHQLSQLSREHAAISLGLSTRGALALLRCGLVEAALQDREYVIPDDIKAVATQVMAHRLIMTPEATLEGIDGIDITQTILNQVEIPRENQASAVESA